MHNYTYIDKNPVKFAQSTCIYTDDQGNVFKVFIRANTKRELLDFIKNRLEPGAVKIKAEVVPNEEIEKRFKGHREEAQKQKRAVEEAPTPEDLPLSVDPMAGITIEVTPAKVTVPEGHKIVYNIDPPMESGLSEIVWVTSSQATDIEVECVAIDGSIEASIFKRSNFNEDRFILTEMPQTAVKNGAIARFLDQGNLTGIWKIVLTGKGTNNTYDIKWWLS